MSTQNSLEASIEDLNLGLDFVNRATVYSLLDLQSTVALTKNTLVRHGLTSVTVENYHDHSFLTVEKRKIIAAEALSKGIAALTLALIAGIIGVILWMTGKKSSGSSSSSVPTTEKAKEVNEKNKEKIKEVKELVVVKQKIMTELSKPLPQVTVSASPPSPSPKQPSSTTVSHSDNKTPVSNPVEDSGQKTDTKIQPPETKPVDPVSTPQIVDKITREASEWFTRHREIFLKNSTEREASLLKKYFLKKIDLKGGIEKLEYSSQNPLLNSYIHDISGTIDINGIVKLMERMSTVHRNTLSLRQTILSDLEKFENSYPLQDVYSNGHFDSKRFKFDKKEELFSFCRITDERIKNLNDQGVYDFLRYGGLRKHVIYAVAKQLPRPDSDIKDTFSIEMKMSPNKDYKEGRTEFNIALPNSEDVEKVLSMLTKFNEDTDYSSQLESKTSHVNKTISSVNDFLKRLKNQIEDVNRNIESNKFEGETLKRATYWLKASNAMTMGIEKVLNFCTDIDKVMIKESQDLTMFITDYSGYSYEVQKTINEKLNVSRESLFSVLDIDTTGLKLLNW